jgi:uncharacterized membrane protein YjjP (DUF1212 family)
MRTIRPPQRRTLLRAVIATAAITLFTLAATHPSAALAASVTPITVSGALRSVPPPEPEPEPSEEPIAPEEGPESPSPSDPADDHDDPPSEQAPEPTEDVDPEFPAPLPGLPPAAARTNLSATSVAIAVSVLIVSATVLVIIVRRKPSAPTIPTRVRLSRTATSKETLDALVTVGEAMIDSGYPSNLTRGALEDIATANAQPRAEIVVFPTALIVTLNNAETTATRAVSAGHRDYLLYELDGIDHTVRTAGRMPGSAGWVSEQMSRLRTMPAPFTRAQRIAAYVLVSAAIAVLLGANWLGLLLAAVLGAGVGVLLLLGERVASNYQVLVIVAASFGVSLAVFTVARTALDPGVLPSLIAPLVILLPGGLLTTSVIELATGHIMSGAARAAAGAMRLLLLAVGIVAAGALIGVPSVQLDSAADPLGPVAPWIAVAVFGVGIAVNQCARPRSIGWIVLLLYVAYGAQVLGDILVGGVLSALVGAAVVTPIAVIIARQLSGPPAIVSFLPAFWLLVPGALGLVGVTEVLGGDATGARTIVTTIATMIAIALGVLIGLASTSTLRSHPPRSDPNS